VSSRSRASERANSHPRLARSRPRGDSFVTLLAARTSATDPTRVHPCVTMKGLSGAALCSSQGRSVVLGTKASSGERDPIDVLCRSAVWRQTSIASARTREFRECDLITCCVASPPRCPSDRHRLLGHWGHPRKRVVSDQGFSRLPSGASASTQRAKAPSAGVAPYRSRGAK
jgi:hypothetical protein